MRLIKHITGITLIAILLHSCSGAPSERIPNDSYPDIIPDYIGVTIPEKIAKLTFEMADGSNCRYEMEREGDTLWNTVTSWRKGDKMATLHKPFPVYISDDPIDPYIAYRLIEPGYESWHNIVIAQRELASYKESRIVSNRANDMGCVNCHTFDSGNPQRMLFHARGKGGGTVFIDEDQVRIINLAQVGAQRQGTYPAWHPSGRYVVFSSNSTFQCFTVNEFQPIEVYDTASDIILMDLQTDSVMLVPQLSLETRLETFPAWSEDGSTLYFCSAEAIENVANNRGKVHYRLMSARFEDGQFVGEPEELFGDDSCSVSFPRYNDGYVLFTHTAFGTFPIWHGEADLWMYDVESKEAFPAEILNSEKAESYHSWSSNGKWVIFGSRRLDGRYTRVYIAHYKGNGEFDKPFLLPQKNFKHNTLRLKSYNIPEFIKGEVKDYEKAVSKLFK